MSKLKLSGSLALVALLTIGAASGAHAFGNGGDANQAQGQDQSQGQGQAQSTTNSNNSTYTSTAPGQAPGLSSGGCTHSAGIGLFSGDVASAGFTYAGRKCVVQREADALFAIAGGGEAGRVAWITHVYKNDARMRRTLIALGWASPAN